MLKRVTLGFASRQVISKVLSRPLVSDINTARNVREIRRQFNLKKATRLLDKLNDKGGEFGQNFIPSWDDLIYPEEYIEKLNDFKKSKEVEEEKARVDLLISIAERMCGEAVFTIDQAYLTWLQEEMKERQWDTRYRTNPKDGSIMEFKTAVTPGQYEAIADLSDAINAAINSPDASEENKAHREDRKEKSGK